VYSVRAAPAWMASAGDESVYATLPPDLDDLLSLIRTELGVSSEVFIPAHASLRLNMVSWNVDCVTPDARDRMCRICEAIRELRPDLVCLQEVNSTTLAVFRQYFGHVYVDFVQPGRAEYYCIVGISRSRCTVVNAAWRPYASTEQQRGFLLVRAKIRNRHCEREFFIATTHLESGPLATASREAQLWECCGHLSRTEIPFVLAGDFNLRAKEMSLDQLGDVQDAYFPTGCAPSNQFTWTHPTAPWVRGRFDRVYGRNVRFHLLDTVDPCHCSDHSALVCEYDFKDRT
jgi:endonuclease/exonuclease/phosphatase family metal-dependent hydrolase